MLDWWNALQPLQQILYVVAIPATLILLLQTILTLIGFTQDGGGDVDHDGSFDHDGGLDHDGSLDHGDLDHGGCEQDHDFGHDANSQGAEHSGDWHLITVRGVVAFLTLFGWVGIALLDMHVPAVLSIFLALVAGSRHVRGGPSCSRSPTTSSRAATWTPMNAIGLTGEVYVPILENAKGKVTLIVQERFTEMDAICPAGPLKTGQRVPGDRRRGKRRAGGGPHRLIPTVSQGGCPPLIKKECRV